MYRSVVCLRVWQFGDSDLWRSPKRFYDFFLFYLREHRSAAFQWRHIRESYKYFIDYSIFTLPKWAHASARDALARSRRTERLCLSLSPPAPLIAHTDLHISHFRIIDVRQLHTISAQFEAATVAHRIYRGFYAETIYW